MLVQLRLVCLRVATNVLGLGVCYFALQTFQVYHKFNRQNNSTKPLLVAGAVNQRKMSKKVRIIERTMPDGRVEFTIQERHFLFFWWWVDAWMNHDVSTTDSFPTLAEAQKNLCYFDGTKCREVVVQ